MLRNLSFRLTCHCDSADWFVETWVLEENKARLLFSDTKALSEFRRVMRPRGRSQRASEAPRIAFIVTERGPVLSALGQGREVSEGYGPRGLHVAWVRLGDVRLRLEGHETTLFLLGTRIRGADSDKRSGANCADPCESLTLDVTVKQRGLNVWPATARLNILKH